jgi:hypothetical protein
MKRAILAMALLLPLPAYSEAIDIDRSRSVGPTVSIITPSGINCSETAGDRPSLWLGGRIRDQKTDNSKNDLNTTGAVVDQTANNTFINSNLFNEEAGWSVGAGVHIPFGGPPSGNCKRLFAVAKAESYILVLDKLLDKKAITLAEYTQLVKDVMEQLNDKKESK